MKRRDFLSSQHAPLIAACTSHRSMPPRSEAGDGSDKQETVRNKGARRGCRQPSCRLSTTELHATDKHLLLGGGSRCKCEADACLEASVGGSKARHATDKQGKRRGEKSGAERREATRDQWVKASKGTNPSTQEPLCSLHSLSAVWSRVCRRSLSPLSPVTLQSLQSSQSSSHKEKPAFEAKSS
jgi:hypothetical protein